MEDIWGTLLLWFIIGYLANGLRHFVFDKPRRSARQHEI